MVTDFLSWMEEHLPEEEVNEQIAKIPEEGLRAVLDNARTPITDRGEAAPIRAEAELASRPSLPGRNLNGLSSPDDHTTCHRLEAGSEI